MEMDLENRGGGNAVVDARASVKRAAESSPEGTRIVDGGAAEEQQSQLSSIKRRRSGEEEKEEGGSGDGEGESSAAFHGIASQLFRGVYGRFMVQLMSLDGLHAAVRPKLPTVLVLGAESVGKSSTLERVVLQAFFPRGTSFCTRMPIRLQLRQDLNPGGASQTTGSAAGVVTLTMGVESVRVPVESAAEAIAQRMEQIKARIGEGLCEEELTIELRSKFVPSMDLVDLPGIVGANMAGEVRATSTQIF